MTRLLSKSKHIVYTNNDKPRHGYINCRYGKEDVDGVIIKQFVYQTTITILDNGDMEVLNTMNGVYHDNTGPAFFVYEFENAEPTQEKYYLEDGQCRDREDWLERRDKTKHEPFADMLEEIFQEMGM